MSEKHTIQEDFEHFLSYSGLSDQPAEIRGMLFKAFEAGAPELGNIHIYYAIRRTGGTTIKHYEYFSGATNDLEYEISPSCLFSKSHIDRLIGTGNFDFPHEIIPVKLVETPHES